MKVIKIKKNGKIFLEEQVGEGVKVEKVKSLKEYLACEVEFERGLTFGTLFKMILKEKEIFDIVFCQELNGRKLKEFEKKLNEEIETYEEDFKLEYLEISKIFELFTFQRGSTIDLFSVFIGMGKTQDGFDVFIPLSFCSLSELRDLEILPNKLVEVYKDIQPEEYDDDDELDDEENEDSERDEVDLVHFFEAATRITLYEAIQCIIYEIAYYENDEERIKVRKNQNNEQMNKNKIAILEIQLAKHIDNEEYEKATTIKRELDKLKTITNVNKN
jgi:hypothetical protein